MGSLALYCVLARAGIIRVHALTSFVHEKTFTLRGVKVLMSSHEE